MDFTLNRLGGVTKIADKILTHFHMPIAYNPDGSRKRFKYTNLEERKMLHFLANEMRAGNKEAGKKGLLIWKKYVSSTVVDKTPSGLESHFRKMMLPKLYLKCNEVSKEDFFLILRVFKIVLDKKKIDHIENSLNCSVVVDKANVFQYAVFFMDGDRQTLPRSDESSCHDENKGDSEESSGVEGSVVTSILLESNSLSKSQAANETASARRNHRNSSGVADDVNNETLKSNNDINNRNISVNLVNSSRRVTSSPVHVDRPNPLVTFFETASSISGNENNNEVEDYQQITMEDFQSTQSTVVEEAGSQTMEIDANHSGDENSGSRLAENRGPASVQLPNFITEKAKLIKKSSYDFFPITSPTRKRIFLDRVVSAIRVYGGNDVDSSNVEAMNRVNAIFDGIVDDDEQPLHRVTKQRVINGLRYLFQQPTTSSHGTASRSNSGSSSSNRNGAGMAGDADQPGTSRCNESFLPLRRSSRHKKSPVSSTNSVAATAKMKHRLDAIKKSPKSPKR